MKNHIIIHLQHSKSLEAVPPIFTRKKMNLQKKKKETVPFVGHSSALSSQVNLYLQTKQTKALRKSQPRSAYLQQK